MAGEKRVQGLVEVGKVGDMGAPIIVSIIKIK